MRNLTGYKLRLRNRKLYHRIRSVSRWWNAHLLTIARKSYLEKGRFAKICGPLVEGTKPTTKQELVGQAAKDLDAMMAHAVMSYEGSARLLTFRGGEPLPWSAMVLARTAFEASLRILWILDPGEPDEVLLARAAANIFEDLEEARKRNTVIPDEFRGSMEIEREGARDFFEAVAGEWGLRVLPLDNWRKGAVQTSGGEQARFPFVMVDAATKWWSPVGVYTYRWLCSFTHASFTPPSSTPVPVAALDEENACLILHLVTDCLWKAMDAYSTWLGMPNGIVRHKLDRVFELLEGRIPANMRLERPPTEVEGIFQGMVETMEDLGFVSKKAIKRFEKHFVRRLGHRGR